MPFKTTNMLDKPLPLSERTNQTLWTLWLAVANPKLSILPEAAARQDSLPVNRDRMEPSIKIIIVSVFRDHAKFFVYWYIK